MNYFNRLDEVEKEFRIYFTNSFLNNRNYNFDGFEEMKLQLENLETYITNYYLNIEEYDYICNSGEVLITDEVSEFIQWYKELETKIETVIVIFERFFKGAN